MPAFPMEDDMSTPPTRRHVSLAATLVLTLALGACASAPRAATIGASAEQDRPLAVRFDNGGRERVYVYLIGQKREWLLGRVEPGATAMLRLPDASLADDPGFVQLAVITGAHVTQQAARDPRARLSIAQPTSAILSQGWRFAMGELTSPVPRAGRGNSSAQSTSRNTSGRADLARPTCSRKAMSIPRVDQSQFIEVRVRSLRSSRPASFGQARTRSRPDVRHRDRVVM